MSGFPIVDLVVGIIFVYFLLSIICSSVVEMCITASKLRGKMLEEWLKAIFQKPVTVGDRTISLGEAIMDHCGTTALSKSGSAPSYIDAKNFTAALLEKISFDPANPKSVAKNMDEMIAAIESSSILPPEFQGIILGYAHEVKDGYQDLTNKVKGELEMFKGKIENWYDTNMDRVSGALKIRYTRKFTLLVAIGVAIAVNADTISIARYLYKNPDARKEFAAQAYTAAQSDSVKAQVQRIVVFNESLKAAAAAADSAARSTATTDTAVRKAADTTGKVTDTTTKPSETGQQIVDSIASKIVNINATEAVLADAIPLGWNESTFYVQDNSFCGYFWLIVSKIAGLAMTVFAIMMGAPFWFDVLNKISNMRSAGTKPPSSTK